MTTTEHPFHLVQCIGALRIEVDTGMKHSRGSILKLVQQTYGVTSRTKRGALTELEALYAEKTGWTYGKQRKENGHIAVDSVDRI